MKKVLALLAFCLMAVQLCMLPAKANADIRFTAITLPVTEITATGATFNGNVCILGIPPGPGMPGEAEDDDVGITFQYGTAPGVYTFEAPATLVSVSGTETSICAVFSAVVNDLVPCSKYYTRVKWRVFGVSQDTSHGQYGDVIAGAGTGIDGTSIFKRYYDIPGLETIYGDELSFTTFGCQTVGSPGSGGFNAGGPTTTFNPSNIIIQSATLAASRVTPGERINIAATATNRGGSNGTAKITLYVNGQEAGSKGISLASGQTAPVEFSISQNEPGTYSVSVNGVSAGSFVVDAFSGNAMLIYGIIALFTLGIIGVLYLVVKRRAA